MLHLLGMKESGGGGVGAGARLHTGEGRVPIMVRAPQSPSRLPNNNKATKSSVVPISTERANICPSLSLKKKNPDESVY